VTIGNQTWIIDNLAYLPSVSPSSESSDKTPYYYLPGYEGSDVAAAKSTENYTLYGVLYNWEAAKKCCPEGWHLPTDEEWSTLASYINSLSGPFDITNYPTMKAWWGLGSHLYHTSGWADHKNGLNTYGFSALPAGGNPIGEEPFDCGLCEEPDEETSTAW
jgi:uncharacterized protein (TIGR02145 family)